MNFDQFKNTTGAGGDVLARAAWDQVVALVKATLPTQAAEIDAALAFDPSLEPKEEAPTEHVVEKNATDSGGAAEGTK
jgi:hypothetical protein